MLGRPHGVHGEINLRPHDLNGRALEGARRLLLVVDGHTRATTSRRFATSLAAIWYDWRASAIGRRLPR